MLRVWVTILSIVCVANPVYAAKCHSCLTQCSTIDGSKVDPEKCDCRSEERDMCEADACFAKVEIFLEESTAVVQKGCVSDLPGGQRGCHYASNTDSIHCYCDEDKCNDRKGLKDYKPIRLPMVHCCSCSERNGDHCPKNKCDRTCKGHYCVVDFDGVEQGCGLGLPRLPLFLRTQTYPESSGDSICARYETSKSQTMSGCICSDPKGPCNTYAKIHHIQETKVIPASAGAQPTYCYSLRRQSSRRFGEEVYKDSTTCEGHYCFVSLTTSELVLESVDFRHNIEDHKSFIGVARPNFIIQAGCLNVDDPQKVTLGCTIEKTGSNSEEISRHCVCSGSLCNFHHLLTNTTDLRPKANQQQQESFERDLNSAPKRIRVENAHASTVIDTNSTKTVKSAISSSFLFTYSVILLVILFNH
ncbi:unnamed protein product [Caenorhabditis auriculariae]|uniref:UPAR/Ly6 domain-containing protein n=1 Tax=Caenorhabditis auriculariae TaxID=2777116 RepID=A0A8S1H0M4_9PELO|nr:unnamed protein product [Caenorhabditis auriculariae]